MQRRADGTFEIEFRLPNRRTQRETGRWKVEGRTYTTVTLSIDGKAVDAGDPRFTDVYILEDLKPDSMSYFHPKMNLKFKSIRVSCPNES
jgi:hypothetical protein